MKGITIKMWGVERLLNRLNNMSNNIDDETDDVLEWFCNEVVNLAKDIHYPHWDTGNLWKSIKHKRLGKLRYRIQAGYPNAPYAVWIEFGSRRNTAYPFLTPAFYTKLPEVEMKLKQLAEDLARKSG